MNDETWKKIVILHNSNKALFIWCEENDCQLKSFLQPNNELKNAWEHAIRAKANELGLTKEPAGNQKYIAANLDKVLGHEYRAFFDICDWLSINLRKRLTETLSSYDNETINAVIPKYYTEIRPRIEKFCKTIADLRCSKDIAVDDNILWHVSEYQGIVQQLMDDLASVSILVPSLEEHKNKKEAVETKGRGNEMKVGLISAAVGALLLAFGEWVLEKLKAK